MANLPTRNNNPGDLRNTSTGSFNSYPTPQEGYTSLLNDLQTKVSGKSSTGLNGSSTLEQFASKYAPSSDDNNVGEYTANLANQLKVAPDTQIGTLQPRMTEFADAVAKNEGYDPSEKMSQPTATPTQSKSPSFMDMVLGGGSALLAGGLKAVEDNAGTIGTDVLKDAATDAAVGTAIEPGGGSLLGAGVGVVQGLADSLLGGNKTPTPTPTGSTSGVIPPNSTDNIQQEIQQQEMDQEGLLDQQKTEQQIKDSENATNALNQTLQTTPTGKLLASQPSTQQALQGMAQNGYLPDTSTGVNDFSTSLQKNAQSRKDLSNGVAEVLDTGGEQGSLDDAKKNAYANIEKYSPIREQEQQKSIVDKEIETYRKNYGDNTSLGNLERAKREQGSAAGDWQKDTPTRAAHKALYGGFRTTVTNNTKHKDLYERVMKEETKSFKMDKLMKKMQGKKALEHKGIMRGVFKAYGKYVGTYLGDRIGGPLGAIVGTMVGDHLTRAVDKRFGKTYFESKEGKKLIELASKKSPAMAKILKKELEKYGVKAEAEIKEHLRKEDVIKKRHQEWQKERQQKGVLKQDNQKNRNSFIPSNEWQEVPKGATMPNGLTFKMDMKTGKNYAKKA